MAALKLLVIVQNVHSGEWIAGFDAINQPIMSPKIQDSYLFFNGWGASRFSSRDWKQEKIWVRAFKPPRPRPWKSKKFRKTATKSKKTDTPAVAVVTW